MKKKSTLRDASTTRIVNNNQDDKPEQKGKKEVTDADKKKNRSGKD